MASYPLSAWPLYANEGGNGQPASSRSAPPERDPHRDHAPLSDAQSVGRGMASDVEPGPSYRQSTYRRLSETTTGLEMPHSAPGQAPNRRDAYAITPRFQPMPLSPKS